MEEQFSTQEILEYVQNLKPDWAVAQGERHKGGFGFVQESIFSFHCGRALWIVLLCDLETVAFKEVSAEWLEAVSNVVLSSPEIFVEFDRCHRIVEWAALQQKTAPEN